jgi:hypothetical protein
MKSFMFLAPVIRCLLDLLLNRVNTLPIRIPYYQVTILSIGLSLFVLHFIWIGEKLGGKFETITVSTVVSQQSIVPLYWLGCCNLTSFLID